MEPIADPLKKKVKTINRIPSIDSIHRLPGRAAFVAVGAEVREARGAAEVLGDFEGDLEGLEGVEARVAVGGGE